MTTVFSHLLDDAVEPSHMPDVRLLRAYMAEGCPAGEPLCLSFGETWTEAPAGLVAELPNAARAAHGYQLSLYGLPELRRAIKRTLVREHRLPARAVERGLFEVAVSWGGTRSSMFDFGRHLIAQGAGDARAPVVLSTGPSWDYTGVFRGPGFKMRYLSLRPENRFAPDPDELDRTLAALRDSPDERLALVIVNAQHNPTAVNWSPDFVRAMIRGAWEAGASVLVDDAYFRVHNEGVEPTSALAILLEELARDPALGEGRWLMVRSLGKQFHCNGWGVGCLAGSPALVDHFVNTLRVDHQLMYGGVQQGAMARWLASPGAEDFLAQHQRLYARKRERVARALRDGLQYPEGAVHAGECTSYMMFAVPPKYRDLPRGVHRYRDDVFARTGVLLAPAWPWPWDEAVPFAIPYVRAFLGPRPETIDEAFARLAKAGFAWDAR